MAKAKVKGQGNSFHPWHVSAFGKAEKLGLAKQPSTLSPFHAFGMLIFEPVEMVVVLSNGEELEEMGQGPGGTNLYIGMVSKIVKMTV